MNDRRMEVVDVDGLFDRPESDLIGGTVDVAALDPADDRLVSRFVGNFKNQLEGMVILGGDRVELVIVAARAGNRA